MFYFLSVSASLCCVWPAKTNHRAAAVIRRRRTTSWRGFSKISPCYLHSLALKTYMGKCSVEQLLLRVHSVRKRLHNSDYGLHPKRKKTTLINFQFIKKWILVKEHEMKSNKYWECILWSEQTKMNLLMLTMNVSSPQSKYSGGDDRYKLHQWMYQNNLTKALPGILQRDDPKHTDKIIAFLKEKVASNSLLHIWIILKS